MLVGARIAVKLEATDADLDLEQYMQYSEQGTPKYDGQMLDADTLESIHVIVDSMDSLLNR